MPDNRRARMTTVYGTVMSAWNDGRWCVHRVEGTGPDGRRITFEVAATKRHHGSVAVRWDRRGLVEPRFVPDRSWIPYAVVGVLVVIVGLAVWLILT